MLLKSPPVILPFYHTVSDVPLTHIQHLYKVKNLDQFHRELDFFQKNYTAISLVDLIAINRGEKTIEQPSFHLTFDDGLKECSRIIAPILKERGLDATFFINPNFINNEHIFYRYKVSLIIEKIKRDQLKQKLLRFSINDSEELNKIAQENKINFEDLEIYMNHEEIQQLIDLGFTIGAHSMSHPYYKDISIEQQITETNNSIDFIQEKFNLPYRVFSFPFTDFGVATETFEAMNTNISFGTAGIKTDILPHHLQRLPMDNCLGNPSIFVYKHLLKFTLQSIFNKHQVKH